MPHASSNQKDDQEQKKDDRLIILLGIGVYLLLHFFFSRLHIPLASSQEYLRLQWNGTSIVIHSIPPLQPEGQDNPVYEALIPATFTPFFFAPLPINEADQQLLETLPGIGPHLASEIILTRSMHGPIRSPEDLLNIRGIGKKRMLKFADQFSYR